MKKIIILALMLFPALLFGQNARSILDKAYDSYTKSSALSAKFTLDSKDVKSKTTYSVDGTAYMLGNKFKLDMPDAITWFDGATQWVYVKDNEEVNISIPEGDELLSVSPSAIFSIYKKGFDLKFIAYKTIGGKKLAEISLIPQNKKIEFSKILVYIDEATNRFVKIVIYDKGSMETTLTISNYKAMTSAVNSFFAFDKKEYPNVEVIDLR